MNSQTKTKIKTSSTILTLYSVLIRFVQMNYKCKQFTETNWKGDKKRAFVPLTQKIVWLKPVQLLGAQTWADRRQRGRALIGSDRVRSVVPQREQHSPYSHVNKPL